MNLDCSKYKYKAVIDFIQLDFKTAKPTNAFSVQRKMKLTYVEPLNKSAGGAASEFRFKFHDLTSWKQLEDCISNLKRHCELENEPTISGIEVSIDAYSNNMNKNELIEHTAQFCWKLAKPVSQIRRFSKTKAHGITNKNDLTNKIIKGGVIYIGNQRNHAGGKQDPISMRIYLKEKDKKIELNPSEHRARIEITLVGAACPFHSIADAKKYKLSNLNSHFTFRNFKQDLSPLDNIIINAIPTIAEKRRRSRIGGGTREFSRLTTADTKLNRIVYDRLRNLTRRLNT